MHWSSKSSTVSALRDRLLAAAAVLMFGGFAGPRVHAQQDPQAGAQAPQAISETTGAAFKSDVTTMNSVPLLGPKEDPALHIDFAPAVWAARVRADSALGGPTFSVDGDLGLNGYEAAFNGELAISWDEFWRVQLTGWTFSTDASITSTVSGAFGSVNIAVGDRLSNSFAAASAGGEFSATLWRPFSTRQFPWGGNTPQPGNIASDGRPIVDFGIQAIGAVRWYSASMTVNDLTAGTSASWSLGAVMPGVGGGIEFNFNMVDRVSWLRSVRFEAAGGTGSNFTNGQYFIFARAGLRAMFTEQIGGEFGYRLEDFNLSSNGASFDGGVQGLYVGIDVRF
ncbi:MAG: hypothetical protein ACKO4V_05870 [Planctomycetota bacterium]